MNEYLACETFNINTNLVGIETNESTEMVSGGVIGLCPVDVPLLHGRDNSRCLVVQERRKNLSKLFKGHRGGFLSYRVAGIDFEGHKGSLVFVGSQESWHALELVSLHHVDGVVGEEIMVNDRCKH